MKYNLKNRPEPWQHKSMKEWFEGFEKELRERININWDDQREVLLFYDNNDVYDVIKEILGDA